MWGELLHRESPKPTQTKVIEILKPLIHSQLGEVIPPHAHATEQLPVRKPDPSEEYSEGQLDLNEHLLKNPDSTFFVRVSGDSMIEVGIHPGDLLVVDRSVRPGNGKIVIAVIDGDLTVKKLFKEGGKIYLMPENPSYPCIEITNGMDFMIWGVVTHVIHSL